MDVQTRGKLLLRFKITGVKSQSWKNKGKPGSPDAACSCLVPWPPSRPRLRSCKSPLLAWLARNAQINRFSSAWLALCSHELAHLVIPCAGRWREDPRVTSPVPAIHRLYIFPPAASLSSSSCRSPSAPPVSSTSSSSSPRCSWWIRGLLMPTLYLDLLQVPWICVLSKQVSFFPSLSPFFLCDLKP